MGQFSRLGCSWGADKKTLAWNYMQSKSVAISLTCYPKICYQTLYYQLSCDHINFRSSLICYLASIANDTFAIKPHLLSGQFTINPRLQSTILLSFIICYQIFDFLLILIFTLKICKKNGKISQHLEIFILWQTVWAWNWLILLPQVKVSTFWKILTTSCISTKKTRHTIHRPPACTRNTVTDTKRVTFLQEKSNEQVLIATCLGSNLYMARKKAGIRAIIIFCFPYILKTAGLILVYQYPIHANKSWICGSAYSFY